MAVYFAKRFYESLLGTGIPIGEALLGCLYRRSDASYTLE
jgi:hypothetical protein